MKDRYLVDPVEEFTGDYQSLDGMERYYQLRKAKFLNNMIKNLMAKNYKWLLDIGSGEGLFLNMAKKSNQNITTIGLDLSLVNCKRIKKNGHEAICADGENLPIKNESVDVIFFLDVIEHLPEANILDDLYGLLNKNGVMLLSTPNKFGVYEYKELVNIGSHRTDIFNAIRGKPRSYFPYHIHLYSMKEIIETLEKHDFFIANIHLLGFCFPFSGIINRVLAKKHCQMYNSKTLIRLLELLEKRIYPLNFQIILRTIKRR